MARRAAPSLLARPPARAAAGAGDGLLRRVHVARCGGAPADPRRDGEVEGAPRPRQVADEDGSPTAGGMAMSDAMSPSGRERTTSSEANSVGGGEKDDMSGTWFDDERDELLALLEFAEHTDGVAASDHLVDALLSTDDAPPPADLREAVARRARDVRAAG